LLANRFIVEYQHGIDLRYKHEQTVDGESVLIDFLDCSSSCFLASSPEECRTSNDLNQLAFQPQYLTNLLNQCDILLLVYSITDRLSFRFVQKVLAEIALIKGKSND
jgi:hypothetical protein